MRRLLPALPPLLPRRRATRKLGCCACTAVDCFCLNLFTLCFFSFCCFLPRMLGATVKVRAAVLCVPLCAVGCCKAVPLCPVGCFALGAALPCLLARSLLGEAVSSSGQLHPAMSAPSHHPGLQ